MIRTFRVVVGIILLLTPFSIVYASPFIFDQDCEFDISESVCPARHPGSATTGQRALTDSISVISVGISKAIAMALRPKSLLGGGRANTDSYRTAGLSAGDYFYNWSGWVSYARTHTENTRFVSQYDSNLDSALAGFDTTPKENLIVGLAVGYENNDIDTTFSGGEQQIDGFTIAPYAGYLFHPNASLDLSAGYSSLDIDQFRRFGASIIDGDTDSDRWFISGNLNAFTRVNDFAFSGRVGVIYAEDDIDAIVETGGADAFTSPSTTVEFGQIQVGGEVAYSVAPLEPYASVFYEYDFEYEKLILDDPRPAANDRSDVRFGLGARYFSDNGFSANLEWNIIAGRDEIGSHTLSLTGRLDF